MNENTKPVDLSEIANHAAEAQQKVLPIEGMPETSAVSDEPGTGNNLVLELKRGRESLAVLTIPRFPEAVVDQETLARDVILLEQAIERLTGVRCHATLTVGIHKPRTRS